MSLKSQIESLLFISPRPLAVKRIAELTGAKKDEVKKELRVIKEEYNQPGKGINLQKIGLKYQMVTNPENSQIVSGFIKEELTGELTPASLETLTVIAYRGPITKMELEIIRGVNCSVILRNLMMRGLVEEIKDKKNPVEKYRISFDFMRHLGIAEINQLPDYEKLNSNEALERLLNQESEQKKTISR
ncbi:MAG TPA: SMC-Scp complex subunit ScpB [Candidatus Uhrbacteria bacterium]|nr:SMC-Scp complex subunit ScpB [Candidatus Uhrbacteria bacterium]